MALLQLPTIRLRDALRTAEWNWCPKASKSSRQPHAGLSRPRPLRGPRPVSAPHPATPRKSKIPQPTRFFRSLLGAIPVPKAFTQSQLQAIADALGDTSEGLTGTEIGHLLGSCKMFDSDPGMTKRHRLY